MATLTLHSSLYICIVTMLCPKGLEGASPGSTESNRVMWNSQNLLSNFTTNNNLEVFLTDGSPKVKSWQEYSAPVLWASAEHLSFDWLFGLSNSEYFDKKSGFVCSRIDTIPLWNLFLQPYFLWQCDITILFGTFTSYYVTCGYSYVQGRGQIL